LREQWKEIKDYNGKYRISNYGRVIRKRGRKWIRLRPFRAYGKKISPYIMLTLLIDGKLHWKKYNLKNLVAEYWMLDYDPAKLVSFKDKTKPNDCSNLNITQVGRPKGFTRLTQRLANEIKEKIAEKGHLKGYRAYLERLYGIRLDNIEDRWNDKTKS